MTRAARFVPAALALLAIASSWSGLRAVCRRMPGPPGFDVVIKDPARGETPLRVPHVLGPEVVPPVPHGGSLEARATFLAAKSGKYVFHAAASAPCWLAVDGKRVRIGRTNRHKFAAEVELAAGAHAIDFVVPRGDVEGASILGFVAPEERWGASLRSGFLRSLVEPDGRWTGALVGPDEAVAAPTGAVRARLGARPGLVLSLLAIAPTVGTILVIALALVAMRAPGRARWRRHLEELAADPTARKIAVALALAAIVWPMVRRLFAPGYYACHEEESYIIRFFEYEKALRAGVPLGRWWDDPVHGRGYPFLCLYAPLLYLVATPLLLAGVGPVWSVKLVTATLVTVGATATYRLARRHGSAPAALVAATIFTWAPYLQTDVWVRADIAESLGFATLPLGAPRPRRRARSRVPAPAPRDRVGRPRRRCARHLPQRHGLLRHVVPRAVHPRAARSRHRLRRRPLARARRWRPRSEPVGVLHPARAGRQAARMERAHPRRLLRRHEALHALVAALLEGRARLRHAHLRGRRREPRLPRRRGRARRVAPSGREAPRAHAHPAGAGGALVRRRAAGVPLRDATDR